MSNILLVYPDPVAIHPRYPNALLPLAAVLLDKGHKVDIFDEQFDDYKKININKYDIVGISILTGPQISNALKIAAWIKKKASHLPVIWGGVHCSLLPYQTAKNKYVDVAVKGEGEQTLLELIDALQGSRSCLANVKGIVFKAGDDIISTEDREFFDLNKLPILPYHLLSSFHRYSNIKRKIIYFQSSRGCPFSCGFCYSNAVHKRSWRAMSPERVIKELRYIRDNFKPELVAFIDDELFIDQKRVSHICRGIIDFDLKIKWTSSGRYDQAYKYDNDFLELLKESGCVGISFGGESGSTNILREINKGITIEQAKTTVGNFRKNKLPSTVNFMAGFPGEKKEDLLKTFDFIDELTLTDPDLMVNSISIYTPFPNTPLYQKALDGGFKDRGSLESWGSYFYNDVNNLPWIDKRLRKLLKTISLLTECEFNRRGRFKSRGLFEDNPIKRILYNILSYSAKLRWRHRFFAIPLEWDLLDIYLRLKKSGER